MGNYFIDAASLEEAEEIAGSAVAVVKVEDGYMAFDTAADYHTWENQK